MIHSCDRLLFAEEKNCGIVLSRCGFSLLLIWWSIGIRCLYEEHFESGSVNGMIKAPPKWLDGMMKGFDLLPGQSAKGCRRITSYLRGHTHCTPLTMNQNVRSPPHVNPFCVLILLSPIFRTESSKITF